MDENKEKVPQILEEETKTEPQPPKPKRLWLNILVVFVVLGILIYIVFRLTGDINAVMDNIKNANVWYLILAVVGVLVFSLLNSFSGHAIFIFSESKINFANSLLIQNMEMFWNGITPFSSGAAPIQGYYYVKSGADSDKTTSVMLSSFIIYQMVMIVTSLVVVIVFRNDIGLALATKNVGWYFILIGFSINAVVFFFSIFFSFSPATSKLFNGLIMVVCKIKPLRKKKDKWLSKATSFTSRFQNSLKFIFKRKRVFFVGAGLKIASFFVYYLIPVIVILSLGYNIDSAYQVFYIMGSVLLASSTMMWVPLPGASGGTETAFVILLSLPLLMLNDTSIFAIMLLWRFITYYFGMLYGGINYLILKRRLKS